MGKTKKFALAAVITIIAALLLYRFYVIQHSFTAEYLIF